MLEGSLHLANHPGKNTAQNSAKKLREGCLQKLRNTELAKKTRPLLEENKEVSSWAVDTHTYQPKQQESKVERQGRGKN
jgi:outer membrane protein assembly factor BamD (BamD/ComL family)